MAVIVRVVPVIPQAMVVLAAVVAEVFQGVEHQVVGSELYFFIYLMFLSATLIKLFKCKFIGLNRKRFVFM